MVRTLIEKTAVIISAGICLWLVNSVAGAERKAPDKPQDVTEKKLVAMTSEGWEIHRSGLLIDGHNDLPWQFRKYGKNPFDVLDLAKRQESVHTDIPRLRAGGVGGQFWVVYVPSDMPIDKTVERSLEQFDYIHRMIKRYPDDFELALDADDVLRIHKKGKIASLIGVEGGHCIGNSLENLRKFHKLGARYMTLTHSANNDWADSATDKPKHGGLTDFGEQVVLEMNRLGMLVDISHVSFDTMRDALRVSKAPIIASHSSAYAVARHKRNVPDDVLKEIAKNGGVVMATLFPGYIDPAGVASMEHYFQKQRELKEKYANDAEGYYKEWNEWRKQNPIPDCTVHTVVDHIDYIVKVAGIDHAGIGSDYDGIGKLPAQLEDVSGFPFITQELLNRGYSKKDIHKIMGQNILRVMREAQKRSHQLN